MITPKNILLLIICFYSLKFLFETILLYLNYNCIKRNRKTIPKFISSRMDMAAYSQNVAYNLEKHWFAFITGLYSLAALFVIIISGSLGTLETMIFKLGLPFIVTQVLYIFAVTLIFGLLSIPGDLYSNFRIEQKYGFNTMTIKTYIADLVKKTLLNIVLLIPLLLALFRVVEMLDLWWIWGFCLLSGFQILISMIYPVFIAPLFNKYTPLSDDDLKKRLESLAERTGFKMSGIFVMDGSKRSRHSNAMFMGLGRKKRIVLYDTLIQKLKPEEIEAVLAHEIGHYRKKHILKSVLVSIALNFAGFYILGRLLLWKDMFIAFGFQINSIHAALVVFAFCSEPFMFVLKPLFSLLSRKYEYEADAYAKKQLGKAKNLVSALLQLGYDNKSNMTVHSLYSIFYYSHPALPERIRALD